MSGFVYIWFDRKKKRYYIGSHWGSENDGYVCSSSWMKQAYKKRFADFKERRILARVNTTRDDLLKEEQRWLDMIKPEELGKRYYNLIKSSGRRWHTDEEARKTVGQRISYAHQNMSPEKKKKFCESASKAKLGKPSSFKGKKQSPEAITKIKEARARQTFSDETRRKLSESRCGKPRSEETKRKIAETKRRQWLEKKKNESMASRT